MTRAYPEIRRSKIEDDGDRCAVGSYDQACGDFGPGAKR